MSDLQKTVIFDSDALVNEGAGLRFPLPQVHERATGFVIRFQGKPYAYVNQCAHLPVELDWNEGAFFTSQKDYLICATHGAHYQPDTGFCVMGPCKGKSLTPIQVTEQDRQVIINIESLGNI